MESAYFKNILFALFFGFVLGVLIWHTVPSPNRDGQSVALVDKKKTDIRATQQFSRIEPVHGTLEEINHKEKFIVVRKTFNLWGQHIGRIKIYFDESTDVEERLIIPGQIFNDITDISFLKNLSYGDSLSVFIKNDNGKFYAARVVHRTYNE